MPSHRWITACAALLLCVCATRLSAASRTFFRGGAPYTIDTWGTEHGLPQSSVIAMTQTRDGYLWLGTLNGLVRFDGIRFTVFDESNTEGLNSSRIVSLFEDSQGNLWVGTETAGVALVRGGRVTSLDLGRGGREGRVMSMCEDAGGAVWLYTADGQLCRYLKGKVDSWRVGAERFSQSRVLSAEKSGPLWVGMDSRLMAVNAAEMVSEREPPIQANLPLRFDFVLASQKGGHWRLADGRVQKWGTNWIERDLGAYPWGATRIATACEDREGNLLVGTLGQGVCWFDAEGNATSISTNQGLSHQYILSMLVDREGTVWVGTDGRGLNRLKRQVFDVVEECGGWVVQSVCEDNEGGVWFGSNGNEAGHWKAGVFEQIGRSRGLSSQYVRSMFADRTNRIWAGTVREGLFRLQDGFFQRVAGAGVAQAIHQDRAGRVWLGTDAGLARWDENEWKLFTRRDGLTSDDVRAITDDAEGNLWIGTVGGGLNRFRDGQFTSIRKGEGLPSDNISALWLDRDGVLWVGTDGGGLARFHQGKWTRYTTRDGLVSNSIGYLLEDAEDNLWIGSNLGLMRAPKKALNDFAQGRATIVPGRVFGVADGMPTGECTAGSQPAACRARNGKLWFPTTKGLASVSPAKLRPNTNPPPVMIEAVLIDGQALNASGLRATWPEAVTMPAHKEHLEIHFTSLNLSAPDRARFKYRLEGHERAWTEAGNTRIAHYSKLPPGDYRFQVTACNEDEVWNDRGSTLAFVVEPPFWRTWWFLTGTAACLLGTIIAVVHYLSTQKLQRQLEGMRQKEALERERARIARDLHDQLGASLTQVSLLGELAVSDKALPDEVESHARQITQTARDTTHVLDEIVWAVNPSNDTLDGLINYACKYAQDYLSTVGLRYRLDVPAQLPNNPIAPDVRHNVFLAFKESITNVAKHAGASSVWVRLKLEAASFTLEIEDDGKGPAGMESKSGRNGLRNMRKRMEDVGGAFAIGPGAETGTLVRLTAPIGKR